LDPGTRRTTAAILARKFAPACPKAIEVLINRSSADIPRNPTTLAKDRTATLADETTFVPGLRGHLLGQVADGRHLLPVVGQAYILVRTLDIRGSGLRKPTDHSGSKIGVASVRNVHQYVQVLAPAILVALTRPRRNERKAVLPSVHTELIPDRGRDRAVGGGVLILERPDRDHHVQRATNPRGVLPAVGQFFDTLRIETVGRMTMVHP
jgi:hypothetical protein